MQQRFRELLEAASNAAGGSDYALAKALAVPRQTVSNWRTGHKPCPPDMQALMAQIAGLDPLATLARATIEKAKEPERQERLKDALKKAWARTGGVATFGGFVTAVAAAIATMLTPVRADAMGLAATSDNVHYVKYRSQAARQCAFLPPGPVLQCPAAPRATFIPFESPCPPRSRKAPPSP